MNDSNNNDPLGGAVTAETPLSTLKSFFSGMKKIFSVVGKVFKGFFILLIIVGVISWIGLFANLNSGSQVDIPESGALRVSLNGYLVDELSYQSPLSAVTGGDQVAEHQLRAVIHSIDAAAEDDRINSMVLVLHEFGGGGSSKVLELGEAILRFRESGKPVLAAADLYTQQSYLLASFADEIFINPMGGVELKGLGSYRSYFGDALDKLKVNFHVFRTGEFKDAVEPFIENQMSEASANQTLNWLEDIWQVYRETISANRGISYEQLDNYANAFDQVLLENEGDAALAAEQSGLVDALLYRDEIRAQLMDVAGPNEEEDFYLYTNYRAYLSQVETEYSEDSPVIGLVVAAGNISDGQQSAGSIGGDTLSAKLREMRKTENLEALVLRVDSPGGSAFASEVIRRELELYDQEGIPVVVSMGSLAASGGYWISMPAEEIWATPTTLTGSIGVFGIIPTIEDSLETIGIRRDGVGTGPLANALILDMPLSDQVASIIQSSVDHIYDEFLELVSASREISVPDLDALAQGRVWTGNQALELGLVDSIGSLQDAVRSAAELAGISDQYQLYEITPQLSLFEQITMRILDSLSISSSAESDSGIASKVRETISGNLLSTLSKYIYDLEEQTSELSILLSDPAHQYLFCGACQNGGGLQQP